MENGLSGLATDLAALQAAWAGNRAVPASELTRPQLVEVLDRLGDMSRRLDSVRAEVATEIDRESRPELGADSLAKQHGYRSPAAMIAATTGIGTGDANRLVTVGKAIAPRQTLTGEPLPARHPHVAAGVKAGRLGQQAASMIIGMLERVAVRSSAEEREVAERTLVERAPGLSLDQLRKLVVHAEAWLDQDGAAPSEREKHGERFLRMYERDGFLYFDGKVEIVSGAPLKTAVEELVSAAFRATKQDVVQGDDDAIRPTVAQLQADALLLLAEHALGCEHDDLPLNGATVVVRMTLQTLTDGLGLAQIDGVDKPISPNAARHLAATSGIIPVVLDGASEVMDWGREKRLFTKAQRLALAERDGGCAMCNLPVHMTKAHHLNWWLRDRGRTNIDEGVLLCESCHHRIHDNGWEIEIEGRGVTARVWFIPPPTVDSSRTRRLGGRARFDYAA